MTLSTMGLFATLSMNVTQHNDTTDSTDYHIAECHFLNVMLSAIMLNVIMLSVVMLSVVAPFT